PIQAVQAQQAALVASQTGTPLQATSPVGQPYPAVPQSQIGQQSPYTVGAATSQTDQTGQNARTSTDLAPAPNFQEQYVNPGEVAGNREAHTFGELAQQL